MTNPHVDRTGEDTAGGFEALFEDAPCGFLCVSPDWRIERANATFAQWTGFEAASLAGRAFVDLLDVAGKIYVNTHFAPLLRLQGKFDEVALNIVCADGAKLPVLVNARERRGSDDTLEIVLVSIFNATDRRRYESELLDARNALREANETLERRVEDAVAERMQAEEALAHARRMEAIGSLSAGIAHDFNNLLQVIGGNLQLLRKHVSGKRGRERIANATGGVERGARLARQLLAFGRRQTLDAQVHDLGAAVRTLADTLVGTISGEVELRVTVEDGPMPGDGNEARRRPLKAHVDLALLENAVINLTVNARDAMRDDRGIASGTVTLGVSPQHIAARVQGTAAGSVEAGTYIVVAVSDTGGGMPPEVARKVFDPFFTTKAPGEGTGLGLSMVYGFATQSNGHVTIDSAPEVGTTVRLWLPQTNEAQTDATLGLGEPVARGTETILVVEDDEAVLNIARELLGELGYEVLTASDGTNALAVLDANKPIHLVLTDVVMPGPVRGTELAALVRERYSETAVLFTTGYADAAARMEIGKGEQAILRKPFTSEELGRAVSTALNGTVDTGKVATSSDGQPEARLRDRSRQDPARDIARTPEAEALASVDDTESGSSKDEVRGTGPEVLLVEDEFMIRADAAELLGDLGCVVTDVGTIAEALDALESKGFDALVTDVDLEDGSGIDLARQARERYPNLRVIFATGHGAVEGAEAFGAGVLPKPYDQESLGRALRLGA